MDSLQEQSVTRLEEPVTPLNKRLTTAFYGEVGCPMKTSFDRSVLRVWTKRCFLIEGIEATHFTDHVSETGTPCFKPPHCVSALH